MATLYKQTANKRRPYALASYSSAPIGWLSWPGPLSSATTQSDVTCVFEESTKEWKKVCVCVRCCSHSLCFPPRFSPPVWALHCSPWSEWFYVVLQKKIIIFLFDPSDLNFVLWVSVSWFGEGTGHMKYLNCCCWNRLCWSTAQSHVLFCSLRWTVKAMLTVWMSELIVQR